MPSSDGVTFPVFNPATEEHVTDVFQAGTVDVDLAVDAALKAFPKWRDTPVVIKASLFRKLADLIIQHGDELAHLERIAMGK